MDKIHSDLRNIYLMNQLDDELMDRFLEAKETAKKFQNGDLTLKR